MYDGYYRRLVFHLLTIGIVAVPILSHGQAYPIPPQTAAGSDGVELNDGVRIPAGSSGFVDPSGVGYCRAVTNSNSNEIFVPIANATEWQYFRSGEFNSAMPSGVNETICCRPSDAAHDATLCSAATGGTQRAQIVGQGVSGYAKMSGSGSATATCHNPPYGDYVETQTFNCTTNGASPAYLADGAWSGEVADNDACQPNSYTTYGSCSQACSTGGSVGQLYETIYNSCGQVTNQGYFGPTCNMQSCCTTDYVKSCSGSTATYTDVGTCHSGSYQVASGCTFSSYTCHAQCSNGTYPDPTAPDANGCVTTFHDCGFSWVGSTSGGTNCVSLCNTHGRDTYVVSGCTGAAASQNGTTGVACGIDDVTCTCGDWQ